MSNQSDQQTNESQASQQNHQITHFGYQQVTASEKPQKVKAVFDSVAESYDLMNDFMSLGIHRYWKHKAVQRLELSPHHVVVDLAAGTGDLSYLIANKLYGEQLSNPSSQFSPSSSSSATSTGKLFVTDINASMLQLGRNRLIERGADNWFNFMLTDAEFLPFQDNSADRVIIAFGLRNVTHKQAALNEIYRILKPSGRLVILEFSQVKNPLLRNLYDWYSFNILPKMGQLIAQDKDSYQYLAESIRQHPPQQELATMLTQAGFHTSEYENFQNGVVALHLGIKGASIHS